MDAIERENDSLKGVLPKVYARQNLDPTSLGGLIDLVGNIALGDAKSRSADVLGHVFEYFLGEFALAEGKKGGQFYTPRSVVELLVKMLEPYKGRVFDPCCGSGRHVRAIGKVRHRAPGQGQRHQPSTGRRATRPPGGWPR
jgi:type I restriction enzyme M protein